MIENQNPSINLKNKTIHGMSWSVIDNLISYGINFILGIILARLLTPEDYGMIGIVLILVSISNVIVNGGLGQAIIRKKNSSNVDYNTVFLFNLILGFLFYLVIFFSSEYISLFFNQPRLVEILQVMGVTVIITAFSTVQSSLFTKNIDFKSQTKFSLISFLLSGIIGLIMAFNGYGVWSLVAQNLSRNILQTILLWINSKWKPAFQFSISSFNELFGFGSKLLFADLINTLYKNSYYFIIGKFYTSYDLGQYTRAESFSNLISNNFSSVFQRVSYPILSEIQNEKKRLFITYEKLLKSIMIISFFGTLFLAAISKPLILLLIGEKWQDSIYYLQIICLSVFFYPSKMMIFNLLKVKGLSNVVLKLEALDKLLIIPVIILGIYKGIVILLWGSVVINSLSFIITLYYSCKILKYPFKQQVLDFLPIIIISCISSLIIWGESFIEISNLYLIILQFITGVLLFITSYELTKIDEYFELKKIVSSYFLKIKYKVSK